MIGEVSEETEEFEFSRSDLADAVCLCESGEFGSTSVVDLGHLFWLELFEYDLDAIESTCSGFYVPQAVEVRGG